MSPGGHWTARPEGGLPWLTDLYQRLMRRLGRPLASALLYPITLYFYLVRGAERRASKDFWRRLGRKPTLARVFKHIHWYAQGLLDRVFMSAAPEDWFHFRIRGAHDLRRCLARGRGCILVGSHVGSFEASRYFHRFQPEVPLRLVLNRNQNRGLQRIFESLSQELADLIIDPVADPTRAVLDLSAHLRRGGMAGILADRHHSGERTVQAEFLGAPVAFPAGPWHLAAATGAPVMLFFGLYLGGDRYEVVFEPFRDRISLPREDRDRALAALVQEYAARLEARVRAHPCNWFNFYDYWALPAADPGNAAPRLQDSSAADKMPSG